MSPDFPDLALLSSLRPCGHPPSRFVPSSGYDKKKGSGGAAGTGVGASSGGSGGADESALAKICRDTSKLASEQIKGLSTQIIKQALFNCRLAAPVLAAGAGVAPVPMET